MKNIIKLFAILPLFIISTWTFAQSSTPVGTWTTIDDKSHQPRSVIQIWESYGKLYGKIVKTFPKPGDTGICKKCPGAFKDKPIKGLTIMWQLKSDGANKWSGGEILDPESGNIYKVKLKMSPDGKTLDVRGYIGFSLFGRTQVWHRGAN